MKAITLRRIARLLLVLLLGFLLYLTLFRERGVRELQLIPLVNILDLLKYSRPETALYLIGGNIAWFVPFGFLLPLAFRVKPWQALLLGGGLSLGIEVTQLIFGLGLCEIDDLLLNTLGAAIGAGLYSLWKKKTSM